MYRSLNWQSPGSLEAGRVRVSEYTNEKLDADWEIRIYPGANATFTVYEDTGDGYGYEKGEFATWKLNWNDATSTLNIDKRKGRFPDMVESRTLNITVIRKATDSAEDSTLTRTVNYEGEMINVQYRFGKRGHRNCLANQRDIPHRVTLLIFSCQKVAEKICKGTIIRIEWTPLGYGMDPPSRPCQRRNSAAHTRY